MSDEEKEVEIKKGDIPPEPPEKSEEVIIKAGSVPAEPPEEPPKKED